MLILVSLDPQAGNENSKRLVVRDARDTKDEYLRSEVPD